MTDSANRTQLLKTSLRARPLWALTGPAGKKVSLEEIEGRGELVAHYAIDELGTTGQPRIQLPTEIGSDKLQVDTGDILVSRLNPRRGHVFRVEQHDTPALASSEFAVVRPATDCDSRFVRYVLQTEFVRQHLDSHVRSATKSHGRVEFHYIWNMLLPSPSLDVQRRIADYLDAETARIDALLGKNDQLAQLASEQHERFVVQTVTRGTRPSELASGLGWCDDVAAHFTVGPYAMYGRTGSGHTPSRSVPEYWVDCDIPWVTTGDVAQLRPGGIETIYETAGQISRLGMANSAARLHPAGTVFLSRTASVGFAGIMGRPMATSQDFFTWTPDGRLTSEYLLWTLRAMRYGGLFDRLMYGSTHKTIYVPDLLGLRGPIPSVEEQGRIVDAIRGNRDHAFALLQRIRRSSALLRERRQALITAAVTGELEV